MTERRVQVERRQQPRFTIDRMVLVATFACSLTGSVFGLGVYYAKTNVVEAKVDEVPKKYVTKELYENDKQYIAAAIDRQTKVIDKLNDRLDADERERTERAGPKLPAFAPK